MCYFHKAWSPAPYGVTSGSFTSCKCLITAHIRRMGKVMFSVCPHLGEVPVSHNALQHFPECHGAAGGVPYQVQPGWGGTLARGVPWLGGYPARSSWGEGGYPARSSQGGYPGWGGTLAGGYPVWGVPCPGGYPVRTT